MDMSAEDLARQTTFEFEIHSSQMIIMPNDDPDYTIELCECLVH